jgi:hypothetical protein
MEEVRRATRDLCSILNIPKPSFLETNVPFSIEAAVDKVASKESEGGSGAD